MSEAAGSAGPRSVEDPTGSVTPGRGGPTDPPNPKAIRIVVDRDLCQGHGVCENEAPNVFRVQDKATTVTVLDETPPESERKAVEMAVKYCPTHALSIEEIDQ